MHITFSILLLLNSSAVVLCSVLFAPYLDATTDYNPTPYHKATGTSHFTLAFVIADKNGQPQWNGYSVKSKFYADNIAAIRAFGGDVSIAFGGAAGTELALVAKDAASLASTYINILNTYQVTWADFDVEGSALSNTASIDLRNKAIAIMQSKIPNLKVSYTLPVSHTGLASSGLYVIQSAVTHKARVDIVNIMTMDYYEDIPYVDSNGKSLMGQYAISAAQGTYKQVGSKVGSIGICPMIGINDDKKEVFTLADAAQVAAFAKATSYVSWVSFWVVGADLEGNVDGKGAVSGAYAKAFVSGLGGGKPKPTATTATTTRKPGKTTTRRPTKATSRKPTKTTTTATTRKVTKKTKTAVVVPTKSPKIINGASCSANGSWACANSCICAYGESGLIWQCNGVSGC